MTLPVYTGTLTRAHCQLITGIRERWMATVGCTAPVDRAAAAEAVCRLYDTHKLRRPPLTIWMDSPLGRIYAAAVIGQPREPSFHGTMLTRSLSMVAPCPSQAARQTLVSAP